MTPEYTIVQIFLPNLMKTKGPVTLIGAIERKDHAFLDALWTQAHLPHKPYLTSVVRDGYRIGIIGLPPAREMGEAHLAGFVMKQGEQTARYFTLEHKLMLATKTAATVLCEREGGRLITHGEGPKLAGDVAATATAFIDAIMDIVVPKTVTRK